MVIEKDRKNQGHDEEQDEHPFVICSDYQQEEEADQQDQDLCGDNIGENGSHKKPVFTFEKRHTVRAVMTNLKRMVNDP